MSHHVDESFCGSPEVQELPSRVLDVGPADGSSDPKLHISSSGEHGHYVTLSHCWGTRDRLTTTSRNLEQHVRGIPFHSLPATFRDAVVVVRRLGFRHLWIDALCIVQDSDDDWLHASVLMHWIFARAIFSISAADASDSHAGFLHARAHPSVAIDFNGRRVGLRAKAMSGTEAITTSVLDTRAWCLQERLLPSRVLFFGREQMYWRCGTSQASETMPELASTGLGYRPQVWKLIWEEDPGIRQNAWLDVLTQYSERLLTLPIDRVNAMGGLAALAESPPFHVRFGMPLEGALKSVLWRRTHWHANNVPEPEPGLMRRTSSFRSDLLRRSDKAEGNEDNAPSWSWASLNRPVHWNWRYSLPEHTPSELDATITTDRQLGKAWEDSYIPASVQRDTFHQTWVLSVFGHLRRGNCKITHSSSRPDTASFTASSSNHKDSIPCTLDHTPTFTSTSCYALYITCYAPSPAASVSRKSTGLSASSTDSKAKNRTNVNEQAFVLLLERTEMAESDGVVGGFRRIGMGQGVAKDVRRTFRGTPRTLLVIW